MKWSILLAMIFCHIIDDYKLQNPVLCDLKQKSWWDRQPNMADKYKHDYKIALAMHGMSWSFMIMLPLMIWQQFDIRPWFALTWAVNAVIHSVIDDLKANKGKLNLVQDQCLHLIQIVVTWGCFHDILRLTYG